MQTTTTPTTSQAGAAPADEFYGLHVRTRIMAAREFESFGMEGGEAAAAARDLLDRLAVAFLARGSGVVADRDEFADGVAGALGGRIGAGSERVWSYIAGELLPGLGAAFARRGVSEPGGLGLGSPLPPGARIRDARDAGFFGGLGAAGALPAAEARRAAAPAGISPVIANLLAMSSLRLGRRERAGLLGRVLEGSASDAGGGTGRRPSRRKREGVFYTPAYVARHMCRGAIFPWLSRSGAARDPASLASEYAGDAEGLEARLRGIRVLDPACGAGAFLIEAAGALLDVHAEIGARSGAGAPPPERALEDVRRCLYGMDKSPRSVEAARLAVLLLTAAAPDAGRLRGPARPPPPPPDLSGRIVARDSVGGRGGGRWDDAFPDAARGGGGGFDVIVGNPPYVRHEELRDKGSLALPDPGLLGLGPGFRIPPMSDLASYFHYHSLCHLAEGGRLALIASDGWLGHGYGLPLQRVLLDRCRIDAIVRPSFNVFGDAEIKTAVLFATRAPAAAGHRIDIAAPARPADLGGRRRCIAARVGQAGLRPGNWLAHFLGPAPEPGAPMAEARRVGRVWGCIKTGCDGFFVLTPEEARGRGIAGRFLRPVLSRGVPDGCLGGQAARKCLLCVGESKGELLAAPDGGGVLRYIEEAEATTVAPMRGSRRAESRIPDLSSVRGRRPWYSIGLGGGPPPILLTIFTYRRVGVYRNDGRFLARNNFAAFAPADPGRADALAAHLASSWFGLHMERSGHVAGAGALQFLVSDFARSPVPDLDRMGRADADRLGRAWRDYCGNRDRAALDDAVLGVLGFDAGARAGIARRLEDMISRRVGAGRAGAGAAAAGRGKGGGRGGEYRRPPRRPAGTTTAAAARGPRPAAQAGAGSPRRKHLTRRGRAVPA